MLGSMLKMTRKEDYLPVHLGRDPEGIQFEALCQ